MNLYNLIFTKNIYLRYLRHFLFWFSQYIILLIFNSLQYLDERVFSPENAMLKLINMQIYIVFSLLFDAAFTYFVVYWLVPKFLPRKLYYQFAYFLVGITVVSYLTLGLYHLWFFQDLLGISSNFWIEFWYYNLFFLPAGPHIRCALFLAGKMLKNIYEKMEEKISLAKENANAELQLLKAQIHPHFLFNTLNNIYSFTLNNSPATSGLIVKLSDTLKYMVNECEAELVPLKNELKMIQDYIGLERVRYGKRLNMEVHIKGDFENKFIAPLLLIPFVENTFKHGSSKMLEHPWIKLQIAVDVDSMEFELSNSKPEQGGNLNAKNGIGLANVKKRLNLLYPDDYSLKINEFLNSYQVYLKLPLQEAVIPEQDRDLQIKPKIYVPAI